MNPFFRKHWITLLGILFFFLSFAYLFQYAVEQHWISDGGKIAIGLLLGSGVALYGYQLFGEGKNMLGQILAGFGVSMLYTTLSFAGIYYALWDPVAVFVSMIALTAGISYVSYRSNLRIVMNLALLGALASPFVLQAQGDQTFSLFLYLLALNICTLLLSLRKSWTELQAISFVGTWVLYTVYYFYMDPSTWEEPLRYACSAFLFYLVSSLATSWKVSKFNSLNWYIGIANAILFGFWSLAILDGVTSSAVPLAWMGLVYLVASGFVYVLTGNASSSVVQMKFIGGLALLFLALNDLDTPFKPMIYLYLSSLFAMVTLFMGQRLQSGRCKAMGILTWLISCLMWLIFCWDTPTGIWFDQYLPFLNSSAMVWVLLAFIGFYSARHLRLQWESPSDESLSYFYSGVSHLIVGGLFTVQIMDVWYHYYIELSLALALSISWGIYALLLFLWGAWSNQSVYRWYGSIMLGTVAVKTMFFDLSGSDTIHKVLVLFLLGLITMAIAYVNNRWNSEDEVTDAVTDEVKDDESRSPE